jgi:hypothetical protein
MIDETLHMCDEVVYTVVKGRNLEDCVRVHQAGFLDFDDSTIQTRV